ncbi:MAG: hypothetical protein ABIT38_24170 [Gemmatimonadaceae bacterium]
MSSERRSAVRQVQRVGLACAVLLTTLPSVGSAATLTRDSTLARFSHPLPHGAPATTELLSLRYAKVIPSYARQTGLACSVCHFQFPHLTPFGRMFKLNGYTMTGLKMIASMGDSSRTLSLSPIAPASVMVVTSMSHLSKPIPETQNNSAAFPQEASIFFGAAIAPRMGIFSQFTYSAAEGKLGIDNIDIRLANHMDVGGHDLLYGLTLHNNPTVQDVFNTGPGWGWPFMSTEITPGSASAMIDGGLAQSVLGLGAYTYFNNSIYAEFTAYRTSLQGTPAPYDSSATNVLHNITPYWRLALTHDIGTGHFMIGTYGFDASMWGHGITGPTDRYTDIAADAQYETSVTKTPLMLFRGSFTHERQRTSTAFLDGEAQKPTRNLNIVRANASFQPSLKHGFTVGLYATSGTGDTLVYAPNPIGGSRIGVPNTNAFTGEYVFNAWQNVRFGAQFQMFTKFNGASNNYDGSGRKASDNNTLYLYSWLAF